MAELIDENNLLPHRIHALIRAMYTQPGIGRDDLMSLVQPEVLSDNTKVSSVVYRKAKLCRLITDSDDKVRTVSLTVDPIIATDFEAFRLYMQQTVLGVTDERADHFVLNLFTAWYAAQNDAVMMLSKLECEARFNRELFPGSSERVIGEHPGITTWQAWAGFLGFGWSSDFALFVPDCTVRLRPLLPDLLPPTGATRFGDFISRLAARAPELDGGVLFERCRVASRPHDQPGNQVSLMLSTALRVLDQQGAIHLEDRPDAAENWSLFPSQSYINRVTHIGMGIAS